MRVCVSVFLHDNSKSNRSMNMKFEYIIVYENISDNFDIGHCQTKVNVHGATLKFLSIYCNTKL